MKKIQLWSIVKEIGSVIDGWDKETFEKEIDKPEMTFAKYLPSSGDWHKMDRYIISIRITKKELDEEETKCARKSTQSVEEG